MNESIKELSKFLTKVGMAVSKLEITKKFEKDHKPLEIFDIETLRQRQSMLDEKFKEKMGIKKIKPKLIKIAYLDEVGELVHELKPLWCYWKKNNKEVDKQRVLEELSDCLHFALSYDLETVDGIYEYIDYGEKRKLPFILNGMRNIKDIRQNIFMLLEFLEYTEEEFLQVHHQVWLRNMNIRTGDDY